MIEETSCLEIEQETEVCAMGSPRSGPAAQNLIRDEVSVSLWKKAINCNVWPTFESKFSYLPSTST